MSNTPSIEVTVQPSVIVEPTIQTPVVVDTVTQPPFVVEVVTNPVQIKGDSFTSVEYVFNNLSSEWIVNHNKGYYPSVIVLNMFRQVVIAQVEHISKNQVRIYFSSDQIGTVIIN